mmetsp:Transcript_1620/g.1721  ORF Transcript_1620/g.1721 Transcript_1620/m.1721 type:complete len:211 (+) Transcript_1620:811-1443(+)
MFHVGDFSGIVGDGTSDNTELTSQLVHISVGEASWNGADSQIHWNQILQRLIFPVFVTLMILSKSGHCSINFLTTTEFNQRNLSIQLFVMINCYTQNSTIILADSSDLAMIFDDVRDGKDFFSDINIVNREAEHKSSDLFLGNIFGVYGFYISASIMSFNDGTEINIGFSIGFLGYNITSNTDCESTVLFIDTQQIEFVHSSIQVGDLQN